MLCLIICILLQPVIPSVDALIENLLKSSIQWILDLSQQNPKYYDLVRVKNFYFLKAALLQLNINGQFQSVLEICDKYYLQAMSNYIDWMVAYEFPGLAEVSRRLSLSGQIIIEDEISLYVKR
jgi:hypothetical protein